MPARVIDFPALWASDKLRACPVWARREYAWVYGVADGHGNFEITNLSVVLGLVGPIREDLTLTKLAQIFEEFEKHGLLYVWEEAGKKFGHWTNCEKRLPPQSSRLRYSRTTPPVPEKELQEYRAKFSGAAAKLAPQKAAENPVDSVKEETTLAPGAAKDVPKSKPRKEASAQAIELARLLRQEILENNPSARITDSQERQWACDADKMMRIDHRSADSIRALIDFSQADPFWLKNILSMKTLRDKFDRLTLQRNGSAKPNGQGARIAFGPRRPGVQV